MSAADGHGTVSGGEQIPADLYDTFERVHWVCFHYEFEHEAGEPDPDQACDDPSCPMRARFPESAGQ